jgi:hypothetical protein
LPDEQARATRSDMFLDSQRTSTQQIQTELSDVYHEQAFKLPAAEKWHIRLADRIRALEDESRLKQLKKTDLMGKISELIHEKPFASCKSICRRLEIPKTTCFRVLHKELGLTKFDLRCGPHTLDANQMAERITLLHQHLSVLQSEEE